MRSATLACCLFGAWVPAVASDPTPTGNELFAEGVRAFKSGNYSHAVDYFRRARTKGIVAPGLFYNLGASLYKLGQYADAEHAFRVIADDPAWSSLASYNIGLAAYQRADRASAATYFERAWRTTENEEIRALALTMLDRIDAALSHRTRGTFEFNLGHNDNVSFTTDNQTLGTTRESDWFADIYAAAAGEWGRSTDAPRWSASFYHIGYAHLSENNISELRAGASKPATFERWRLDTGVRYQYVLLRGHSLQQIPSLRFKATRDFDGERSLHIRAEVSAVDTLDDDFDFLNGYSQELDVSLSHRLGGGQVEWGVTLENDHRWDLETDTEFFSYSPLRYGAWVWGGWPVGGRWRVESTLRYSHSRYADPDRRESGMVATRTDGEFELSLRALYRLTPAWRAVCEYSFTDNNSNFGEFSYTQQIVFLGVTRPL